MKSWLNLQIRKVLKMVLVLLALGVVAVTHRLWIHHRVSTFCNGVAIGDDAAAVALAAKKSGLSVSTLRSDRLSVSGTRWSIAAIFCGVRIKDDKVTSTWVVES